MRKLRLLVTKKCLKNCKSCCNQDWNLDSLWHVKHYHFNQILITGGEPMLFPDKIINLCNEIRWYNNLYLQRKPKIFVYTAKINNLEAILNILNIVDGMTITLHEQSDVLDFLILNDAIKHTNRKKSLRLNVFKDIMVPPINKRWKVKNNIEWIKNCSLPEGETFGRLKELWE
jgi:organic radical activating enzyme